MVLINVIGRQRLREFEVRMLRSIFGRKRDGSNRVMGKPESEAFNDSCPQNKNSYGVQMWEVENSGTCSTYGMECFINNTFRKIRRQEATAMAYKIK
jgi:hypothetical protein